MGDLRTKEQTDKYNAYKSTGALEQGCKLCTLTSIKEYRHWRIVENGFPYDLIAETHHMIQTKRHVSEREITPEEWREYQQIKDEVLHKEYEFLIEATYRKKSVPTHFHIHCIVAKNPK